MDGDVTALEWDEDGLTMTVWLDENPDESGKAHVRLLDPMLLYRLVRREMDEWVAEHDAALREYRSGVADDPAQQEVLDRIKGVPRFDDDAEGAREHADMLYKRMREDR